VDALEFIAKWSKVELKERSAAQEHFLDLCRLVGHPTPAEADPTGESFCFEKGAAKHGGGDGFADVWKKDFFGWEYKGRHKDLVAAFDQLLRYRDALANPPLLVLCDLDRIVIHTNFEKTISVHHEIPLARLAEPRSLEILRAVFFDPEQLRPGVTSAAITQAAARQIADIAQAMRRRGVDPAQVARFLDRVIFCMFAEDIGLLPDMIFTRIADKAAGEPARFRRLVGQLFAAMGSGGDFGVESIRRFNGNLFGDDDVPELAAEDLPAIIATARLDWGSVDPSIFGTLFERGLDPAKRAQLGAHFTGREDIELLVDAVVMRPLRREWDAVRGAVEAALAAGSAGTESTAARKAKARSGGKAREAVRGFLDRLQSVRVLDPACGSGNFLYVTLHKLKDLEKDAIRFARERGLAAFLPMVGPWQLYGIEINPYAFELAQMTVWIGWLQWIRFNGFGTPPDPILRSLEGNFQCRDAILDLSDPDNPREPQWPAVDFIVGNPPFLGGKKLRRELSDDYVDTLFTVWRGRVPREADLCCYWFEKAQAHIEAGKCQRAGLLATQGIRGGANRDVLKRIKASGDIFWAISDKEWILDGANVHVSLVAFDSGVERYKELDGLSVNAIHPNLSSAILNLTLARSLIENLNLSFMGVTPAGPFDLPFEVVRDWLWSPNPHGKPNSDVLRPFLNGKDINQNSRGQWTIDFTNVDSDEVQLYEGPFQDLKQRVFQIRSGNSRQTNKKWWEFERPRLEMRKSFIGQSRFIATCMVAKHRIFTWSPIVAIPANVVIVFSRSDDYFLGVLHSKLHEVWALKLGTRQETRPRYTPTTCFETFPFPAPTPDQEAAIAAAARELDALRERWLNPPEWTREEVLEFPGTVGGPWDRYIDRATVDAGTGIGTVRYSRLVPKDSASETQLKKRTLTNLYNARPAWLDAAHRTLDAAVFAAYGWDPDLDDEEILAKLLELNLARAGGAPGAGASR